MTRPLLFLSDFDGTLTERDFFHLVIDGYYGPEDARRLYREWDEKVTSDLAFLATLFGGLRVTEAELDRLIARIPLDPHAADVVSRVQAAGGDVAVLSAGCDYYITRLLDHHGIHGVTVYSNPGDYFAGGIRMLRYPDPRYASDVTGIDKGKLTESLRERYETVLFAGDSAPDLGAALRADTTFAKSSLQGLLAEAGRPYVPVDGFGDIARYLDDHTEVMTNGDHT